MSPATPANYYNSYGMPSFQQSMYPSQGFPNYPMNNGFYHPYAQMGWNASQYGYPAPMQQDYCGWQQQQQQQHQQHQQQQQQQYQHQQQLRPDQQLYGEVNVLK
uniref:Uncharacterized protein n=1 Tax=Plectus sambesii TaxID=2011161 RepID=A0A914VR01_9BILA